MNEPHRINESTTTSIDNEEPASSVARERVIRLPELSLVVLIGASGSGKSTFAARHFRPTEILSSDQYRAIISDDPNDQTISAQAFAALHFIAHQRLQLGRLTVIDATNVKPQDRAALVQIAHDHDVLPVAIVLNLDGAISQARNATRPDRTFGPYVVRNHIANLRKGLRGLEKEGFRYVTILNTPAEVDAARIEREPLYADHRTDSGPFDIIGDIHGCYDELCDLLGQLGYLPDEAAGWRHPAGRRVIFVGDIVDRGPGVVPTVDLVMRMVTGGQALAVPGNHDMKLVRYLAGQKVQITHGLDRTIAQIETLPAATRDAWKAAARSFFVGLTSHFVLDGGRLVVAHAGMKEAFQGRSSGRVRAFALFGETTGETDALGLPVRGDWAAAYRGRAAVVYGHIAVAEAEWLNNTIDIDTGCVFGGKLTALRWPERALVSVSARRMYAEPARPLAPVVPGAAIASDGDPLLPRLADVQGKQIIATRLLGNITIEADHAAAALEVMSRFALDPRWLIYLPPTMSPCETAKRPAMLEHPDEALAYFRDQGVASVICEEKHMGSRAVLVVCRDAATAARRFGVTDGTTGVCYTRTGRRFFDDDALDRAFIARVTAVLTVAACWERYTTDWLALDAEIMPWNLKARGLIREQYAPVAAAGAASLAEAVTATRAAAGRGVAVEDLLVRLEQHQHAIMAYSAAYRRYNWATDGIAGLRVAPFFLLAAEGTVMLDHDHRWHMEELGRLAAVDPLFTATHYRMVELADPASCADAIAWWEELTAAGGEGMVVKPLDVVVRNRQKLVQPGVKCRGPEYLRIIYGPDYLAVQNLQRLRSRGLAAKRTLALREFALGIEALERFTRRDPLWSTHQAVFGVLALESEPVDPRL